MLKYAIRLLLAAAAAVALVADARAGVIVYREVFPNDGNSAPLTRATDQGWQGLRAGSTTNQLQLFGPTGGAAEEAPVNSSPQYGPNPTTPTGFAFWSPQVFDITIYTTEFSLPVADLEKVTFETRHTNQSNTAVPDIDRLAVRVNGQWYFSATFVTYTSGDGSTVWQANTIDATTKWGLGVANQNDPAGGGRREPATFNLSLPNGGTIDAIGIFTTDNPVGGNNLRGNHRYDNFTVYSTAVPEPGSLALLGSAVMACAAARRRRRVAG